ALVMWDIEKGEQLFALDGHQHPISTMVLIDGGRQIVTTSLGGKIRAWDLETREQVISDRGHTANYGALAVSSDGRTLATAAYDNLVRLWDRATLIRSPQRDQRENFYRLIIKRSANNI